MKNFWLFSKHNADGGAELSGDEAWRTDYLHILGANQACQPVRGIQQQDQVPVEVPTVPVLQSCGHGTINSGFNLEKGPDPDLNQVFQIKNFVQNLAEK